MRFNRLTDPHVPHGPRARQPKGYHRCLKLFAWGEGDSGGHVLRETTSRGLCGLVCPCFPWFLSFGNRTQNSRVAGVSPTTSPAGTRIWSPPRTAGHRDCVIETETVFLASSCRVDHCGLYAPSASAACRGLGSASAQACIIMGMVNHAKRGAARIPRARPPPAHVHVAADAGREAGAAAQFE
jgi:hypothetical protein